MNTNEDGNAIISYGSIIRGGIVTLLSIIFFTVFLGIFINFGWSGWINWNISINLFVVFFSLTLGAIFAGMHSQNMGWITGLGVGMVTSLLLLMMAFFIKDEKINWYFYLIKSLINCFIGAFGGIIGINITKK